jgi:hypothetical protein
MTQEEADKLSEALALLREQFWYSFAFLEPYEAALARAVRNSMIKTDWGIVAGEDLSDDSKPHILFTNKEETNEEE